MQTLEKEINDLTNNDQCLENESLRRDLYDKKKEYESLHEYIVRGIIVRTKAKCTQKNEHFVQ